MSRTMQPCSFGTLSNAGENLNENKLEPAEESNRALLFSVLDNLNNLKIKLVKLDYLIKKRELEQVLYDVSDIDENEILEPKSVY